MTSSSENTKACYDVIFNGSLSFNVFRESRRPFSWIIIIWVFLDFRACLFAYPLINRHAPVFLILLSLRLLPLATLPLLELRRRRRLLRPACQTASVHFPSVVAVVLTCTRQEERPYPLLSSSPHHEPGQGGPPWPGRSCGASRSPRSRPQGRPWRDRAEQVRRETLLRLSRCLSRSS